MIERIERLQHKLAEVYDFHQNHLDRRARTSMTTPIDTILARHQQTLAEALDLLEDIKAKWEQPEDQK